ncbi:glycosyl hydrolase family 57 [Nitrosococcus wardiae]|uniref:Glycosyl hydrolase family 57 n=1 Tax=Nitrosococcus wardiae TaxID=1814290 RepID=A0A4V1AVN0_9GAMM|nr:glycosyl hydrolase family 57 [Nitrosococcus wardiae]QBQ53705.1 glycosyl hydrolase family 57 [Nitrosococcus wardiae]
MNDLPEYVDDLPNLCGSEELIANARAQGPVYLSESGIDFGSINSAFAIALHMQQPLIPAGGEDLHTAKIISNLKHMMDHQDVGDNHNAPVFHWCYKRIGEFVPKLVDEGKSPRVMLDYSGCLLHGLRDMGLDDVFDALKRVTCDPHYRHCVEWLGCTWSHAVAPSTPVQDYRLHVQAWRHHFAAIFGLEALSRVKGFSPAEMALPNHPDVCYEFVKTLKDNGYQWVLVQEHSVEQPEDGGHPQRPHIPHRLVAKNSKGESASIIAIIKTQGSDTKLVAQMQPYYEAEGLSRQELKGQSIPPLVTQIGDGENGGVMMNEFPGKFMEVMGEATGSHTPPVNVSEYLEYLETLGFKEADFPAIQPVQQKKIWDNFEAGGGPEKLEELIEELQHSDHQFHMEGGSWTNNISWVQGYENVIGPIEKVSALFSEKVLDKPGISTSEYRYRNALYYLLMIQTSCYRYWGQGVWTDYARELCRRLEAILNHDFKDAAA